MNDYLDPCEDCAQKDMCDGWDAQFCCTRCMALELDDCSHCDPFDV